MEKKNLQCIFRIYLRLLRCTEERFWARSRDNISIWEKWPHILCSKFQKHFLKQKIIFVWSVVLSWCSVVLIWQFWTKYWTKLAFVVTKFPQMLRVKGITNWSLYVCMPARFEYKPMSTTGCLSVWSVIQ